MHEDYIPNGFSGGIQEVDFTNMTLHRINQLGHDKGIVHLLLTKGRIC